MQGAVVPPLGKPRGRGVAAAGGTAHPARYGTAKSGIRTAIGGRLIHTAIGGRFLLVNGGASSKRSLARRVRALHVAAAAAAAAWCVLSSRAQLYEEISPDLRDDAHGRYVP